MQLYFGILFGICSAFYDNKKRFKNHIPRFIFRLIVTFLIGFLNSNTFENYLNNIALFGSGFYLVFDYVLNILEKRKWNYIGNTALLDKLINKYFNWKYLLITKILLVIIVCILNK